MLRKVHSLLSLILTFAIIFTLTATATAATPRASDYFSFTEAFISKGDDGEIIVEFDTSATKTMRELGAKEIIIYERQRDGSYDEVESFTRYNTNGLIDTNTSAAYGRVTYEGTAGTKYYATVVFYAKDANGSETLYSDTRVITA